MKDTKVNAKSATDPLERQRLTQRIELLKELGEDGMSSDETDTEEGRDGARRQVYRVRILPWRQPVEKILDAIDATHLTGTRGAKRHKRLRQKYYPPSHKMHKTMNVSSREPAKGLPIVLYNEDWLKCHTSTYIKDILRARRSDACEWVKYSTG